MTKAITIWGIGVGLAAMVGTGIPVAGSSFRSSERGSAATQESPGRVGEGAWVNYDFTPGTRPLFVEDFARDTALKRRRT